MMKQALFESHGAAVLALLSCFLLLLHFHDRFWWPPDEGNFAHVAERILDGDALHVDVQDVHAGHINFVNAAAMAIFGRKLVSMRYPLAVVALLQAIVVLAVLRPRGPRIAAIGAISSTALGVIQFLSPTPHWYCLFLTFLLIYWLQRRPPGSPWRLELAGFLVGTIFLFRQLTGVIVTIALVTFLLLEISSLPTPSRARGGKRGWIPIAVIAIMIAGLLWYLARSTSVSGWIFFGLGPVALLGYALHHVRLDNRLCLEFLARLATGFTLAVAPLALYHTVHGALHAWFSDAVIAAMQLPALPFVRAGSYATWQALATLTVLSGQWPATLSGAFWAIVPVLPLGLATLLLAHLIRKETGAHCGALPIVAVFYGLVSVHYAIPIYLFYSLGMSVIGLLWVLTASDVTRRRTFAAVGVLILCSVAVFFQAGQPVTRGPRGIVEGKREPAVFSANLLRSGLRVDAESLAQHEALVALIQQETRADETIAAIPSSAELYFLSERRNPFRFYNTALGVRSPGSVAGVLNVFQRSPPRLVIFEPTDKYNTPQSGEIMAFVRMHYESRGRVGPFEIYRLQRPGRITQ
jgi:hypothetical protein